MDHVLPQAHSIVMRVSVIIPFFNRSHTIKRCLISVQKQTLSDFECLIVDDGSDANEALALQSITDELNDERFKIITLQNNRGGGAARNAGIEQARGEYIAFLDSDDEWLPAKVEKQLELSLGQGMPFISCQSYVHHASGIGVLPTHPLSAERISDYLFCKSGWLQTSSFFLKREALRSIRFNEALPRHQDYDLLFQLENNGIRPTILKEPLVRVHWEDLEVTGRARNIENSEAFVKSRKEDFSKRSYSCFVVKFLLIPKIKSGGRISALSMFYKSGFRFLSNRNLSLEVFSMLLFKDKRALQYAATLKNYFK